MCSASVFFFTYDRAEKLREWFESCIQLFNYLFSDGEEISMVHANLAVRLKRPSDS